MIDPHFVLYFFFFGWIKAYVVGILGFFWTQTIECLNSSWFQEPFKFSFIPSKEGLLFHVVFFIIISFFGFFYSRLGSHDSLYVSWLYNVFICIYSYVSILSSVSNQSSVIGSKALFFGFHLKFWGSFYDQITFCNLRLSSSNLKWAPVRGQMNFSFSSPK